jgi:hypothetical protein
MGKKIYPNAFLWYGTRKKLIGNDNSPAPIYQPCCHFLNIIFTNMLLQSSGRGQSNDLASSKKTEMSGKIFCSRIMIDLCYE